MNLIIRGLALVRQILNPIKHHTARSNTRCVLPGAILDKANVHRNLDSDRGEIATPEKAKGFRELMAIRLKEITEKNPSDAANKVQMQEAQLIIEQLVWLINLSENILKNTKLLVEKE